MPDPAAGFRVSDRCLTTRCNHPTILPKPWNMPLHEFCQVDAGSTLWVFAKLLQPAETATKTGLVKLSGAVTHSAGLQNRA